MDQSPLLQNDKQNTSYWKELPENTRVMLISAIYSGENQKVQLKFYDPTLHVIYFWQDKTDHKPYCYTKLENKERAEEIAAVEKKFQLKIIPKLDLMLDKEIQAIKIIAPDHCQ
jgi:DNA polymerase I